MEAAQARTVPITERLRNIKIGSYTIDHGSHTKHIAVRAICEEAATEIERLRNLDIELRGECVLLADVLRDAFEVVKTVEGEEQDESDKLTGLCLSIAHALALYDDERIRAANLKMKIAEKGALPVSAGKHTPGPWKIDYKKFSDIKTADGAIVATCNNLTGLCNMKNNARLIAAAPDMLDALQFVTGASRLLPEAMLEAVKDAIAKALGESQ